METESPTMSDADLPESAEADLGQLRNRFARLAEFLEEARRDLVTPGRPPSRELLRDLEHIRGKFDQLRDRVHAVAVGDGLTPLPLREHVSSLDELSELLSRVREARKFIHRIRVKLGLALHVVRRVTSLTTDDEAATPALEACHRGAHHLLETFSALEEATVEPDASVIQDLEDLASGRHPYGLLLTLVEQNKTLEDEAWQTYMELVERDLGKPLALAAARGKLRTGTVWSAPEEP